MANDLSLSALRIRSRDKEDAEHMQLQPEPSRCPKATLTDRSIPVTCSETSKSDTHSNTGSSDADVAACRGMRVKKHEQSLPERHIAYEHDHRESISRDNDIRGHMPRGHTTITPVSPESSLDVVSSTESESSNCCVDISSENTEDPTTEKSSDTDTDSETCKQAVDSLQSALKGFLYGTHPKMLEFLEEIIFNQRDYGIYTSQIFKPKNVEGVMKYRETDEFTVEEKLQVHPSDHHNCGVFLCFDNITRRKFVLKRIARHNPHRLIGLEFLTQHNKAFLPKVLGVYKDKDVLHIFIEYIQGHAPSKCNWNPSQVRKFAEGLLSAVHYLHSHNLVHFDIKLMNLIIQDESDPESLVLIDFESAKQDQQNHKFSGYTVTHLPPWFDMFKDMKYHPVLKTSDLWAVACVLIFFLSPAERGDPEKRDRGMWHLARQEIKKMCKVCKQKKGHCDNCTKKILSHVKEHGHTILQTHLGPLMDSQLDDPDWLALRKLLVYLTDTNNIHDKHIDIALNIIKGCTPSQPKLPIACSEGV